MDIAQLKRLVQDEVDRQAPELVEMSHRIHSHPETGFHEVQAAGWLAAYLESRGFLVERGTCDMPTAFKASYGQGTPAVALFAEYDALPQLGHACGHNIIGVAAIGAAVASKRAVDELGGSIMVFGTPAEELYGGKTIMVEQGAFSGLDAALMVHPGRRDSPGERTLACISMDVEFFGKEAHASSHPEEGINALEAMLLSFNAVNSLRQHVRSSSRIHGIITDGGYVANVVPGHSAGSFLVRSDDQEYLEELKGKVLDCFTGASIATGARLQYRWSDRPFAALLSNSVLEGLFSANMRSLGRKIEPADIDPGLGSTDMGNVSRVVPAIHPSVAISGWQVMLHSPEFALAAASEQGDRGLLDSAKALAMTLVDLLARPDELRRVRDEFLAASGASPASGDRR